MDDYSMFERTGFDFIIRQLSVVTPLAHRKMRMLQLSSSKQELEAVFADFFRKHNYFRGNPVLVRRLRDSLKDIRDITRTCEELRPGVMLDDIQLFEIKNFSLRFSEIKALLEESGLYEELPDLEEAIRVLDPEGSRISSFYVYDAYSDELKDLRSAICAIREDSRAIRSCNVHEELLGLERQAERLENRIRKKLSGMLIVHSATLRKALEQVTHLDIDIAKSLLVDRFGFTNPELVEEQAVEYRGLFNPEIDQKLRDKGKKFQAVDVSLEKPVTVLTGANMSGKTILLRTIALSQVMAQTGFFVPAVQARIPVFKRVFFFSGDYETVRSGLSSFAHEMTELAQVLKDRTSSFPMLLLLDELARNTNPQEGTAIVNALVEVLARMSVVALISTHYDNIESFEGTRFLKIKGLSERLQKGAFSVETLLQDIDHQLVEVTPGEVPHEALLIAQAVGIPEEVVEAARKHIDSMKGALKNGKQAES